MAEEAMQPLMIRMPVDMIEALRLESKAEDRTIAQTVRRAVRRYLAEVEGM